MYNNDKQLQRDFEGKHINFQGEIRECYYATLEDGGAWIWLRPLKEDRCRSINFIIYENVLLDKIYDDIELGKDISKYGRISKQQ